MHACTFQYIVALIGLFCGAHDQASHSTICGLCNIHNWRIGAALYLTLPPHDYTAPQTSHYSGIENSHSLAIAPNMNKSILQFSSRSMHQFSPKCALAPALLPGRDCLARLPIHTWPYTTIARIHNHLATKPQVLHSGHTEHILYCPTLTAAILHLHLYVHRWQT